MEREGRRGKGNERERERREGRKGKGNERERERGGKEGKGKETREREEVSMRWRQQRRASSIQGADNSPFS
jgi:hypothetical protein